MFGLSTVVTWCLSDPDVGEGSTLRGRWGGASVSDTLAAASAMEAWWAAARWLWRALALASRLTWRF